MVCMVVFIEQSVCKTLVCVCCLTFAYLSDPHLCCLLICMCVFVYVWKVLW